MKLLHTADWHLGHTLYDFKREKEHDAFLRWLQARLQGIDALIIAGDVFHTANPPVTATKAYFQFMASTRAKYPDLDIVVVGGNHDSAHRLDAPNPILEALAVRVVGGMPFRKGRAIDFDRCVVPLSKDGQVVAWLAAIPYLRVSDLPPATGSGATRQALQALHAEVFAALRKRTQPHQAMLATGHLSLEGARYSKDSERRVVAQDDPLTDQVFPQDLAYVALGHLHLAQTVSGRDNVRYSGSPIPLSMSERDYEHHVVEVELDGPDFVSATPRYVPRKVDMLRVPEDFAPMVEVTRALKALPDFQIGDKDLLPYLEVRVLLERPLPGLRQAVERALEGKAARLVAVRTQRTGDGAALADRHAQPLKELKPEDVFIRRWQQDHDGPVPPDLLAAFRELMEGV